MGDVRYPDSIAKATLSASVENVEWDPHSQQHFFVCDEDGMLSYFDVRALSKAQWTLQVHHKPAQVSCNPVIPHLVATGSTDKSIKLWDLEKAQPVCLETMQTKVILYKSLYCCSLLC